MLGETRFTAEEYDIRQDPLYPNKTDAAMDDAHHSSQRLKRLVDINWDAVAREKGRLMQKAKKRRQSIGELYEELDQEYLQEELLRGLNLKATKKTTTTTTTTILPALTPAPTVPNR
jgi:hypothetical protein